MALTQENRALKIFTPLGEDMLLLTGLNGTEGISAPFRYQLDMISEKQDIEFSKILGKTVNITIELADWEVRNFHGIITRFTKGDAGVSDPGADRYYPYQAILQPAFRLLNLTGDCRIFQKKTVVEIVNIILEEHKIVYKNCTNESYPKREYCVQYNESDFTFVSRILEEEGIFYFFEHEENQHTLVLVDKNEQIKPCPNQEIVNYCLNMTNTQEEDSIYTLECEQNVGPTRFAIEDFNFNTPRTDLLTSAPAIEKFTGMDLELYCYPGDFQSKSDGNRLVDKRIEEEEAHSVAMTGSSCCRALQSGYHFELRKFYRESMNSKKYLTTSVRHIVSQSFEEGGDFQYANSFTCIPLTIKYRPLRTSHKPVMQGSQTATVTGQKGEEIHVDKHGRVKVQFHWDRYGKKDENTSCWIRVSYPSASKGFGYQSHPRIGDEVIVDFLEGDPDRPIITGAVYNGSNPTPYALPDHKTKSTMKTNSSIGGGGYNEFRFEDLKGDEEVYLQAEKDYNVLVKNNRTETVYVNKAETIGAAKELTIGGLYQVTVGGAMNESIGLAKAEEVGLSKTVIVGKSFNITAGDSFSITCGKSKLTMDKQGNVTITGSKFDFEASGHVQITGNDVDIN